MITAVAPACWPKIALATRAHVPRFTTAIVLAGEPAAERGDRATLGLVLRRSRVVLKHLQRAADGRIRMLVGVDPRDRSAPRRDRSRPGTSASDRSRPSRSSPRPVPGDPVMYWFGPLLPADVTTITPALAAFVDATADGSSLEPNGEPSDMLITSMSLSTAHSIASTVTFVEPSAAEDANAVEVDLRRDARADRPGVRADRVRVVGAVVGGAVREHARAAGRAGDVRAVPVAVERVRIRMRDRAGSPASAPAS